jgi:hypothetical protein
MKKLCKNVYIKNERTIIINIDEKTTLRIDKETNLVSIHTIVSEVLTTITANYGKTGMSLVEAMEAVAIEYENSN